MKQLFVTSLLVLIIWPEIASADLAIPPGEVLTSVGIAGLLPGSVVIVIGLVAAYVLVKIRKQ